MMYNTSRRMQKRNSIEDYIHKYSEIHVSEIFRMDMMQSRMRWMRMKSRRR